MAFQKATQKMTFFWVNKDKCIEHKKQPRRQEIPTGQQKH